MRTAMSAVVLISGFAVATSGAAGADPGQDPVLPVPVDVAPAAAPAAPAAPVNPVSALADLLATAKASTPLTSAVPAVGAAAPTASPLAPVTQLLPQNFGMPTGNQPSPYALESQTAGPFARIDAFQGAHALLHAALGRIPGDQLGQPVAGTAPPPGTALPPGLLQYQPEPAPVPVPVPVPEPAPVLLPPG